MPPNLYSASILGVGKGREVRTILAGTRSPFSTSSPGFKKPVEKDGQEVFMPVSDAIHLVLDGALGFGALALTLSMMAARAVAFTCSVVHNVAKAGRLASRPSYDAL